MSDEVEILRRTLERERAGRKAAERLLEDKSLELFRAKQGEERSRVAAERHNERLLSLSEAVPDLLFAIRLDGSVTFTQARRAIGGAELAAHVSPALRAAVASAVQSGGHEAADYVLAGRSYEARVARMNDEEAMVVVRDVTRERQLAAALVSRADEASSARADVERALGETLASLDAGFWEIDLRTGASSWTENAYLLHGLSSASKSATIELWRESMDPDDYARIMRSQSTLANPNAIHEYRVPQKEGGVRWLRSANTTTFDDQGAPLRIRGIVTDITAERATADQLSRFAELANRTANAVVVASLDGKIEWVNEGFTRLSGWTLAEVVGKRPGPLLEGPNTDPADISKVNAALAAREPFELESLNYAKNGDQYWVHLEMRVSRDREGLPTGFVAIGTNVTERRLNERKERLAERIAALLLDSDSLEIAGGRLVRDLVTELDIRAAQFWMVAAGREDLVYVDGAAAPAAGDAGRDFLEATRSLTFARGHERTVGVGLPGLAWHWRKAQTLDDLAAAGPDGLVSRRVTEARRAGIVTFCATPIIGPSGVLGVLEVAGTRQYPGHELIPQLLARVAEQLASFMLHDLSRRAFRAVFDQAPDGLLLVDAAGNVEASNARALTLFGDARGRSVDTLIDGASELLREVLDPRKAANDRDDPRLWNRPARGAIGEFSAEISVAATPSSSTQAAILSVRDLTERRRMEAALTTSLREKETLLREVHHRVKNNLQIVSSLLALQSANVEGTAAQAALEETVHRVRSMALVHQQLYDTANLSSIDFGDYARTLTTLLLSSLDPSTELTIEADKVEVSVEQAVPCGLILNELVTNALKHGRSVDGRCRLRLAVRAAGNGFSMSIADSGPGFPSEPAQASSLGVQLVRALVRQLRARSVIESDGGARVTVHVPLAL